MMSTLSAYAQTAQVLEELRNLMDANRMKSNQTFIFHTRGKIYGIRVLYLTLSSKEKLTKLIADNFQGRLTLVKETPTTMWFSHICNDPSLARRMQGVPEKPINERRLVEAVNEMPVDVLMMLGDKFNWRFDMENGEITKVVMEG